MSTPHRSPPWFPASLSRAMLNCCSVPVHSPCSTRHGMILENLSFGYSAQLLPVYTALTINVSLWFIMISWEVWLYIGIKFGNMVGSYFFNEPTHNARTKKQLCSSQRDTCYLSWQHRFSDHLFNLNQRTLMSWLGQEGSGTLAAEVIFFLCSWGACHFLRDVVSL